MAPECGVLDAAERGCGGEEYLGESGGVEGADVGEGG